jgi:hypothetical protein
VRAFAINGANLFASTYYEGVFLATDNGTSWSPAGTTFGSFSQMVEIDTNLFAGTSAGVFLSRNNGTSWTPVSTGLTNTHVNALAVIGAYLFAGTAYWNGAVFVSTDSGTSWTDTGLPIDEGDNVNALAVSGSNLFAGTGSGVFLSTDNGTSWSPASTPFSGFSQMAESGTNLFAGTGSGVFLSTDHGASWTEVNTGFPNTKVNSLAINGSNLFAGTSSSGVWRRPLSEMTSVEEPLADRRLPENFSLNQNYPNPFNPTTTIAFHLPSLSFVTLKVFNTAGQEIASLVDRQLPAGDHRTEWNASGVPSGIYFYRIQAGAYSETKKLVVMR